MKHVRWHSTPRFSDVVNSLRHMRIDEMTFHPKVKLHGLNLGLRQNENGNWSLQGRNEIFHEGNDQFRANAELHAPVNRVSDNEFIFFGEWAGEGCAKKPDIVSSIPMRTFFVFARAVASNINGTFESHHLSECKNVSYSNDPDVLTKELEIAYGGNIPANIKVMPFEKDLMITIRPFDVDHNKIEFERALKAVALAGEECPFVKQHYGLSGYGEGYVWMQKLDEVPAGAKPLMFKVKSERHDVVKRSSIKHEIVVPKGIEDFVSNFATVQRVEQMAHELGISEISLKSAGPIIKATISDMLKEGANEISAANLDVKQIGQISAAAIRKIVVSLSSK